MNRDVVKFIAIIISIILTLVLGFVFVYHTGTIVDLFLKTCPNKDVLSWDANLRLIGVMDQMSDFSRGNVLKAFIPFFDSPTWPPLRPLIAVVVHGLIPGPISTVHDVFISTSFFILLLIVLYPVALKMTGSYIRGTIAWSATGTVLFFIYELPAYIVSSMLETQGMFFILVSSYFLYTYYSNLRKDEETGSVKEYPFINYGLLVGSLGLYFTKYPYGLMLLIAIIGYEFISDTGSYIQFVIQLFRNFYTRVRRVLLFILIALMLMLLMWKRIDSIFSIDINTRGYKNIVYAFMVFHFVDFSLYVFGNKYKTIILPHAFRNLYKYVLFPILVWQFINPDRVMSAIGSQQHVQDASRSFIESFIFDVFKPTGISLTLLICAAVGFVFYLEARYKGFRPSVNTGKIYILRIFSDESARKINGILVTFKDPLFGVSIILFVQFMILEVLTSNKQLRHIYHLLPSLILVSFLWFLRISYILRQSNLYPGWRGVVDYTSQALPVFLAFYLLTGPSGIFSSEFYDTRPVCFTGQDRNAYQPAREMADQLEEGRRYILINGFHNTMSKAEGRSIASDFDLLFRMKTAGNLRNDNVYQIKSWNEYDSLLVLYEDCKNEAIGEYVKSRTKSMDVKLYMKRRIKNENRPYCMIEYTILPNNPEGQ